MRHPKTYLIAAAAVLLMSFGLGCERRPLFRTDSRVKLELTVHDTVAPVVRSVADGLWQHRFYAVGDGHSEGDAYTGPEGGEIDVQSGIYSVISHNFGTETVIYDGERDLDRLRAYTNVAVSLTRKYEEMSAAVATKAPELASATGDVVWEPDALYGAVVGEAVIPVRDPEDPLLVIHADAWPLVRKCRFIARGVSGQRYLASASCYLSGVARGRYLASGALDDNPATLCFGLESNPSEACLASDFKTFGFIPSESNIAYVVLTDTGGGSYLFPFDVTRQCIPTGDPLVICVDIDFEIPEPSQGGGGLSPSLDDWTVVYHPVNL